MGYLDLAKRVHWRQEIQRRQQHITALTFSGEQPADMTEEQAEKLWQWAKWSSWLDLRELDEGRR
jgi:hypothetical protein